MSHDEIALVHYDDLEVLILCDITADDTLNATAAAVFGDILFYRRGVIVLAADGRRLLG